MLERDDLKKSLDEANNTQLFELTPKQTPEIKLAKASSPKQSVNSDLAKISELQK